LGALVRRRRLAVPLTQQELADAADVHLKSVQAIEAGGSRERPSTIRKLAAALGVPARELADAEKVHARLEAHRDELAQREAAWRGTVAPGMIPDQGGYIALPDKPGLGIDVDEAECAKHPPRRVEEYDYRLRTPDQIQHDRA
jgi:transcriptional regulator with XRE-family HTH domain